MRRHLRGRLAAQIALPFLLVSALLGLLSLLVFVLPLSGGETIDGRTLAGALAVWVLASAAVFCVVSVFVARRIGSSLTAIADGARRVAEGDYSVRIEAPDDTEIGRLGADFNDMTVALRERSESLEKKALDLSALHESSRLVGLTLELETLLDVALDSALRACGADTGYVAMRDDQGAELEIRAVRGVGIEQADLERVGASMAAWVLREARPLIINPADQAGGTHVDAVTGAVSAMSAPLVSSDGPVGALTVGSRSGEVNFGGDDIRLLGTIANHLTTAIGTVEAFGHLHDSYLATVRSLAAAVDAKDPYTRGHSDRVAHFATLTAVEMGLAHEQHLALEMAAYLHDIGKIGIPEDILLKPGRLSDEEMTTMRQHPLIGANILEPVSFPWPITPLVRHHHERWDGSGYPSGLQATRIPILARVLAVADAYEAMIADRPYRKGRTMEEGLAELEACAGSQFDPDVVAAFTAAVGNGSRAGDPDAPC
jgi:putative nucleotidyltransferase with HDIG domain